MELFPSMSYNDVMSMPYKDFKLLLDIRIKRKSQEQEKANKETDKMEKQNARMMRENQMKQQRRGQQDDGHADGLRRGDRGGRCP